MNNPFVSYTENNKPYLTDICSINKLCISELPFVEVPDNILNKRANEIFSTKVIADIIRKNAKVLKVNEQEYTNSQLIKKLEMLLDCEDLSVSSKAKELYRIFGYRLGVILLTLKQGRENNRKSRPRWSDAHWEYWNKLEKLILVGGLTNGKSGEILKKYALKVFEYAGEKPYEILLFPNASHYGTLGCATLIKDKSRSAVVFDFGQTNIKRCIVDFSGEGILAYEFLDSIPSMYMEWNDLLDEQKKDLAVKLHKRLVEVISNTYKDVKQTKNIGKEIIISIASYTVEGSLHVERGGYAKLTCLSNNYGQYLERELRRELNEEVCVTLIHDGSAVAQYFKNYKDAACISLGTAFGVGFPM